MALPERQNRKQKSFTANLRGLISNCLRRLSFPFWSRKVIHSRGVDFSDLLTADIALNDGDVDVNVEQNTFYVMDFNADNNSDLVPICPIPTVPAGIYSRTHASLDEVTDDAKIAIPMMPPIQLEPIFCCRRLAGSRWIPLLTLLL